MQLESNKLSSKLFGWILFFLLAARLLAMYSIPLNDTTEARYGEIARIMQETGNWITPMHHYGEPFWAKPPLSIWLSALSIKWFGVNQLAARIPGMLLSIGVLFLVFGWVKQHTGEASARWSVLVLASSIFFFINAGTVMTDPALLFCITLTLISFWRAVVDCSTRWGFVFFIALGLGLLAKGPVAIVLPIFIWVLLRKQWRSLWQHLPWFSGSVLMLAIALPWYILAEIRTPGFLNYFFIGENIHRFIQPSWSGDKYGYVHHVPYGMIWVYALAGILPWTLPGTVWLKRHIKQVPGFCRDDDGWMLYLILSTTIPLFFFTFASNIIYPYVFPSMPTFAVLFVELARRSQYVVGNQRQVIILSTVSGVGFLLSALLFIVKPESVGSSQQRIVQAFNHEKNRSNSELIYWAPGVAYSAQFYSKGHVRATQDASSLNAALAKHPDDMIVLGSEYEATFPPSLLAKLETVTEISVLKKRYRLMRLKST